MAKILPRPRLTTAQPWAKFPGSPNSQPVLCRQVFFTRPARFFAFSSLGPNRHSNVYGRWSDLPAIEEGNCAESNRDIDCAYRIHFSSRSADERLESTGRLPGSPEHVE